MRRSQTSTSEGGKTVIGRTPRRLSPDEFAAEFAASSAVLMSVARAVIGNRTRAEDALQEAALVALQKLDEFEAGTSFLAWMGRIVRYVSLNELRKKHAKAGGAAMDIGTGHQAAPQLSTNEQAPGTVSLAGGLMSSQASFDDRVVRALGSLEEAARSCLLMRVVHDLPYREIAAILDIPEGTAMSHVHRAKRALREQLAAAIQGATAGRHA